jgi:hypothetical protein
MAAERRAAPKLQIAAVTQPVPAAEGLLTPRTNALHKVASGLALSADELATLRTANTGPSPSASTRSDGRRATFSDSAHEPIRRNSASIELPSQEQPPPPAPPPPPLEQQQLGYRVLLQQQPQVMKLVLLCSQQLFLMIDSMLQQQYSLILHGRNKTATLQLL